MNRRAIFHGSQVDLSTITYAHMNKHRLDVEQFILKKECSQFIQRFNDPVAMFLLFPALRTTEETAVRLCRLPKRQRWFQRGVDISYHDTRSFLPASFNVQLPETNHIAIQLNLVEHLEDSADEWLAIQQHLDDHTEVFKTDKALSSMRLTEVIVPTVFMGEDLKITLQSNLMDISFSFYKV